MCCVKNDRIAQNPLENQGSLGFTALLHAFFKNINTCNAVQSRTIVGAKRVDFYTDILNDFLHIVSGCFAKFVVTLVMSTSFSNDAGIFKLMFSATEA